MKLPDASKAEPLEDKLSKFGVELKDLVRKCLVIDPDERLDCQSLLNHPYFKKIYSNIEDLENEIAEAISKDSDEFFMSESNSVSKAANDEMWSPRGGPDDKSK